MKDMLIKIMIMISIQMGVYLIATGVHKDIIRACFVGYVLLGYGLLKLKEL
jgi:hypothetical protein